MLQRNLLLKSLRRVTTSSTRPFFRIGALIASKNFSSLNTKTFFFNSRATPLLQSRNFSFERRAPIADTLLVPIKDENVGESEVLNTLAPGESTTSCTKVAPDFLLVSFQDPEACARVLRDYSPNDYFRKPFPIYPDIRDFLEGGFETPSNIISIQIPDWITTNFLREQFPAAEECLVSNGNGYVKFSNEQDYQDALSQGSVIVGTFEKEIKPSYKFFLDVARIRPPKIVKIKRARSDVTDDDIRNFFSGLGIRNIRRTSRLSDTGEILPGAIFVEFESAESVGAALEMENPLLNGTRVYVEQSGRRERYKFQKMSSPTF